MQICQSQTFTISTRGFPQCMTRCTTHSYDLEGVHSHQHPDKRQRQYSLRLRLCSNPGLAISWLRLWTIKLRSQYFSFPDWSPSWYQDEESMMTHCEHISGSILEPRSRVTQTVTTQTALLLWVNSPQSLEAEGHVSQSFSSWLLDFVLKLIHKKQCQLLEGCRSVQNLSSMFSLLDSGWGRECRGGEIRKRDPNANKGPSCCFVSAHSLLSKSCML